MKQIKINSLEECDALAKRVASYMRPGMLITLTGDLGAGKTTFTKALGKALGVCKTINSPTFTILKIYHGRMPLYHMDAYRLEGVHQDLGFDEYMEGDGVCVVEWPEYIADDLPKQRLEIGIQRIAGDMDDQHRFFCIHAIGEQYERIEEAIA